MWIINGRSVDAVLLGIGLVINKTRDVTPADGSEMSRESDARSVELPASPLTTRQPSGRETQAFKLSNLKWFNKNPRSLDLPGNKSGAILSDVQINY